MKWLRALAAITCLMVMAVVFSSSVFAATTAEDYKTIQDLSDLVEGRRLQVQDERLYQPPSMADYRIRTYTDQVTVLTSEFTWGPLDILYWAYDAESDGTLDFITTTNAPFRYSYSEAGRYEATIYAVDVAGAYGLATVSVEAEPGIGRQEELPSSLSIDYSSLKRRRPTTALSVDSMTYALICCGSSYYNGYFVSGVLAYETLRDDHNLPDSQIFFVADGIVGTQNLGVSWEWEDTLLCDFLGGTDSAQLAAATDFCYSRMGADDDLILINLSHGNGQYDSVAMDYGFFPYTNPWQVLEPGDIDIDFSEQEAPFNYFYAVGDYPRSVGMYEWAAHRVSNKWERNYLVAQFDTITMGFDSTYQLADDDIYLEQLKQILRGDLNHNGLIDTSSGEVVDWDDDGNLPVDTNAYGQFIWDEDDWNTDTFYTYRHWWERRLIDSAFDSLADFVDWYDTVFTVRATDTDNDGTMTSIDWNRDGDLNDSVGYHETAHSCFSVDTILENFLDSLQFNTVQIEMANCYSGGYIPQASRAGVAIATAAPEGCVGYDGLISGGFSRNILEAMGDKSSDADVDTNGYVSFVEAYNYAQLDETRYDDNGDRIASIGQMPGDSDGALGANLFWGEPPDLDWDDDQVVNDSDNCPWVYNYSQADSDSDDIGDACDCDIDSLAPDRNVFDVPRASDIAVTFEMDVNSGTIDSTSFVVTSKQTGNVPGTFSVTNPTVTFTPSDTLNVGDEISVLLTTDIQSSSGDTLNRYTTYRFAAGAVSGDGIMDSVCNHAAGDAPTELTVADFDGDGHLDAAVCNYGDDNVTVLLGDGSGGFDSLGTDYAVGTDPWDITSADLDGDGALDLVTAAADSVIILFGVGDGSFTTPGTSYSAGGGVTAVVAADLDGDGDNDLATTNSGDTTVTVLLGDGTGGFTLDTSYQVGAVPIDIIAHDLDSDGDLDLAAACLSMNGITVLWNDDAGQAAFNSRTDIDAKTTIWGLAAADFDGDGDPDLAAVGYTTNPLTIIPYHDNRYYLEAQVYTQGQSEWFSYRVLAADFDADGDADLALAHSNYAEGISICINDGTGQFTRQFYEGLGKHRGIAAGDMDGDGDIDAIAVSDTNDSLSVYFSISDSDDDGIGDHRDNCPDDYNPGQDDGDSDGAGDACDNCEFTYNPDQSDLDSDDIGDLCDWDIDSLYPGRNEFDVAAGTNVNVVFDENMDGTSFNDSTFLVSGNFTGFRSGSYSTSGPTATFNPSSDFLAGEKMSVVLTTDIESSAEDTLTHYTTYSFVAEADGRDACFDSLVGMVVGDAPGRMSIADFDDDGNLDIATANDDSITVLLGDGDGTFDSLYTAYSASNGLVGIASGDLDNDDDIDLVATNENGNLTVLHNNSSGSFTTDTTFSVGSDGTLVVAADLDGDGDLDLALAHVDSNNVAVLLGDGSGSFTPDTTYAVGDNPLGIVAHDMDDDGSLDLITSNRYDSSLTILWNEGDGSANFTTSSTLALGEAPYDIIVADLDDDGRADLATANADVDGISVVINSGDREFDAAVDYSLDNGDLPLGLAVTDLDGDGDLDLVTANFFSNDITVLLNDSTGDFSNQEDYSAGSSPGFVETGDLDNDGDMDLLIARTSADSLVVLFNAPDSAPNVPTLLSPSNNRVYSGIPSGVSFDWTDEWSASSYQIRIGLNTYTISSSQYYWSSVSFGRTLWKVRAINEVDTSAWTSSWVFTTGGLPSCPVLFSHNGQDYQEENPLLTACEKSNYQDVVTDYYQLTKPILPVDGTVRFQLRELEDEITYLDDIKLITVDHQQDTKIACSPDGNISSYSGSVAPISAVDHNDEDRLADVAAEDGSFFTCYEPGHLIVTFPGSDERNALITISSGRKGLCRTGTMADEDRTPTEIRVEFLGADGNWVEGPTIPSRENVISEHISTEMPATSAGEVLTVRLSWESSYSTDIINQLIPSEEAPSVKNWEMDDFSVNVSDPTFKTWKGFAGGSTLILKKDDVFEFSFDTDESQGEDLKREYIIVATGRYEPDYSVYSNMIPGSYRLYDAYPNPFNPSTTIAYDLPRASEVTLEVYNITGQKVVTLIDEYQDAGHRQIEWNGQSASGGQVATGVYFYRLTADNFIDSKKMILVK